MLVLINLLRLRLKLTFLTPFCKPGLFLPAGFLLVSGQRRCWREAGRLEGGLPFPVCFPVQSAWTQQLPQPCSSRWFVSNSVCVFPKSPERVSSSHLLTSGSWAPVGADAGVPSSEVPVSAPGRPSSTLLLMIPLFSFRFPRTRDSSSFFFFVQVKLNIIGKM